MTAAAAQAGPAARPRGTTPHATQLAAAKARQLFATADEFQGADLHAIDHLAGDGSGRRYFRLHLSGDAPASTIILVLLSHEHGPVTHGGDELNQDDTFVELSRWFRARGVDVPRVVHDGRTVGALLVDDAGDVALWHYAFDRQPRSRAVDLYRRAIDVVAAIQACAPDPSCVAFGRSMTVDEYRTEARRFIQHYALPHDLPVAVVDRAAATIDDICEACAAHPVVLMHRDFMPWNIHVQPAGDLVVLDFQDALPGSYVYDSVALLHDRDADFALGDEACRTVAAAAARKLARPGQPFVRHYYEALVQRYFRLAGQFHLLTKKTGRPIYESWVPGCLRRIGRALVHRPDHAATLDALADVIPELRAGADHPWNFAE